MNEMDLINKFKKFEISNDLFELEISNIKIWDFIRTAVFTDLIMILTNTISIAKKDIDSPVSSVYKGFSSLIKSKLNNKGKLVNHDVIVFNHPRRKLINRLYVDLYSDYVIDDLSKNLSILSFESSFEMGHREPAYTNNLYKLDSITFLQIFSNILFPYKLNNMELEFVEKIEKEIILIFGVQIDINQKITKTISQYKFIYSKIEKIIDSTKPKIIICIVGYSLINKIVFFIANLKNISTVELQHGTMNNLISYHYPDNVKINSFPKYMFSWGRFWTEKTSFPVGTIVKNMGFPYFEKEKEKYQITNKEKKIVLVISQWTIGKKLSEYISELAVLMPNYLFYYKLHPSEIKGYKRSYKNLNRKNIVLINDNDISLYQLFAKCEVQIGVYSTAIAEGIGFGLKTIILKIKGYYHTYAGLKDDSLIVTDNISLIKDFISNTEKHNNYKLVENIFFPNKLKDFTNVILDIYKQKVENVS